MKIEISGKVNEISDLVCLLQDRKSNETKIEAKINPEAVYKAIRDIHTKFAESKIGSQTLNYSDR